MKAEGLIEGFTRHRLPGDGVTIDVLVGGDGPPLLLLHGYPQSRMAWASVAPALARSFTVVVPDLRGYGRSDKPAAVPGSGLYSKRMMANDQVAVMRGLGFSRFMVAGHDRGGRVAYRLALDHPDVVERIAVLDIVPTANVAEANALAMRSLFHWTLLAQPSPVPERLLAGKTDVLLDILLHNWAAPGFRFPESAIEDYLVTFREPETLHATCEDYRESWLHDLTADGADRAAGRRIRQPLLVLWGEHGSASKANPLSIWEDWATDVAGHSVPGGHFLPEESPTQTTQALEKFFSAGKP